MPRVSAFYGIVIRIHTGDHPPPHFHAEYGEHEALIRIEDGSIYAGSLPRRALRLVGTWRSLHVEELRDAWNRAASQQHPGSIEPLP